MGQTFSAAQYHPGAGTTGAGEDFRKMEFSMAETARSAGFAAPPERTHSGKTGQGSEPAPGPENRPCGSVSLARTGATPQAAGTAFADTSTGQTSVVSRQSKSIRKVIPAKAGKTATKPSETDSGSRGSSERGGGTFQLSSRRAADR